MAEDSILNALKKLSDDRGQIIFSVTECGVFEGVLSDRDLRQWLVKQEKVDLNQPVSLITNKQVKTALIETKAQSVKCLLLLRHQIHSSSRRSGPFVSDRLQRTKKNRTRSN